MRDNTLPTISKSIDDFIRPIVTGGKMTLEDKKSFSDIISKMIVDIAYDQTNNDNYNTSVGRSDDAQIDTFYEDTSVISNIVTDAVSPAQIVSGDFVSNMQLVDGYLQSSNFQSGSAGWQLNAFGNIEANTGIFRGTLYATTGDIGGWVLDVDGFYYDGVGNPSIRTAAAVGFGSDGVVIDKDGIRCYDAILGVTVDIPADGSAPSFSSGVIESTTFEINTNAVIRTSETVGDGSADSAGVLINNTGFYACEANQLLSAANVLIDTLGNAYFKGNVDSSTITSSIIYSTEIIGATVTGGLIRTNSTGKRIELTSDGLSVLSDGTAAAYGDSTYKYGNSSRKYGTGVLAYINNKAKTVPFYINAEQSVGDFHYISRNSDPTGAAEIGDVCVVSGKMKICTSAGTPGTWTVVGAQVA